MKAFVTAIFTFIVIGLSAQCGGSEDCSKCCGETVNMFANCPDCVSWSWVCRDGSNNIVFTSSLENPTWTPPDTDCYTCELTGTDAFLCPVIEEIDIQIESLENTQPAFLVTSDCDVSNGEGQIGIVWLGSIPCAPCISSVCPTFYWEITYEVSVDGILSQTIIDPTNYTCESVNPEFIINMISDEWCDATSIELDITLTPMNCSVCNTDPSVINISVPAATTDPSNFQDCFECCPLPSATISSDATICEGESIVLCVENIVTNYPASDDWNVSWSTGQSFSGTLPLNNFCINVSPTTTTTYTATVSNDCGESIILSVTVTVDPIEINPHRTLPL